MWIIIYSSFVKKFCLIKSVDSTGCQMCFPKTCLTVHCILWLKVFYIPNININFIYIYNLYMLIRHCELTKYLLSMLKIWLLLNKYLIEARLICYLLTPIPFFQQPFCCFYLFCALFAIKGIKYYTDLFQKYLQNNNKVRQIFKMFKNKSTCA